MMFDIYSVFLQIIIDVKHILFKSITNITFTPFQAIIKLPDSGSLAELIEITPPVSVTPATAMFTF